MIKSREYVLERLDQWYADRFRRNYTDEVAAEVVKQFAKSVGDRKDAGLELVLSGTLRKFSREEQIKEAQKYFSQAYATMEGIIEGLLPEEHTLAEIPKGVREEYIDPLLKQFERMQRFVGHVRDISDKDSGRAITDDIINQAFIDSFGSYEQFSKFIQAYMGAMPCFLDLMVIQGQIPKAVFDSVVDFLEITKEKAPYLNEIIFGDLKRNN